MIDADDLGRIGLPEQPLKGVQFTPPPTPIFDSVQAQVAAAIGRLPPDAHGAVISVATTAGWNAAIVTKAPHGFDVQAYVGSKWGEPIEGGIAVTKVW